MLRLDRYPGGRIGKGVDVNRLNILRVPHLHHDGTVDSGSGIPPAVLHLGVVGFNPDDVVALFEETVSHDRELGISVMDSTGFLVVDEDLRVHVNSTESEGHMRIDHLLVGLECLLVDEVASLVEAYGAAPRDIGASLHMDHRVMGKTDSLDG